MDYDTFQHAFVHPLETFVPAFDSDSLGLNPAANLCHVPTIAIPLFATLFFVLLQVTHGIVTYIASGLRNPSARPTSEEETEPTRAWIWLRVEELGGSRISLYLLARLVGCFTLLGLSLVNLSGSGRLETRPCLPPFCRVLFEWTDYWMPITFGYSSVLAILSLSVKKWSTLATRYNIVLLLITFGTYVYRDLWPLATYNRQPEDLKQGPILWVKVATLFVTAVVIPLFIPRRHVPVDPNEPIPTNAEETCSIISLALYTYLDPIILLGSRVAHVKFDQLPLLSDTDYAKNLIKSAFPHLDPFGGGKRRHLVFGLLYVFRKDFVTLAFLFLCQALSLFFSPIGVYKILNYLETGGHGADSHIRPWVWIVCLFLGPAMHALAFHRYIFVSSRTLVRAEAVLTQLVFEHSLRIRLNASSSNGDKFKMLRKPESLGGTPETTSIAEGFAAGSVGDTNASTSGTAVSNEATKSPQSSQNTKGKPNTKDSETQKGDNNDNLIGKINNLVTTDLSNITDSRDLLTLFFYVPIQICLCITFLYQILGWSAFVGLGFMILLFPVPVYIAKLSQDIQRARIKLTDARVQNITEAINVIRMIKLFGWEKRMADRIQEKRNKELGWLFKLKTLEALNGILNVFIPAVCMAVCYATYTVIMKQNLTPSKIFSSITVFSMLRVQLHRISYHTTILVQGKVSIERMDAFFRNTELLDSFIETPKEIPDVPIPAHREAIGFNNATFAWSLENNDDSLTPSGRNFKLRVNGELTFKPDCINLIVGPTGSGKTSILMALLGEMHFIRSATDSWFNLPRDGGVAYAAQESWVQNETIRDNILFGSPYDEIRYRKVIQQCALEKDLEMFDAGDKTEVGEKGLTLSGGQKARVTLARAIYSRAKIILLDDVLAALDVHTATAIVDKCFRGDLLKDRTVLLVTHNLALTTPVASFIVSIGLDGSVRTQGNNIASALEHGTKLAAEARHDNEALVISNKEYGPASTSETSKATVGDGKLVVAEEITEGRVTWRSMKLFLSSLGGDYPLIFFSLWMTGFFLSDLVNTFQVWFLGYWGSQYENHPASEVKVSSYLGQYTAILLLMTVVSTGSYIFFIVGSMRASRKINSVLVESILRSTLRWLDSTPTSRMIARCTQDIRAVDGPIPQGLMSLTEIAMILLTRMGVIIIFTPIFVAPALAVAALGFYMGNLYLKAQLSVKREMSNARSPLLAHFSAATAGIVSIRAYGAQRPFKQESLKRIDHYVRIARTSYNLSRWFGVRIDFLGGLFTASVALYLVYGGRGIGASNTGFTLNMCIDFCAMIMWWFRIFNDFEVQANSLERIQHYVDIEHEPKPTEEGKPPASWPTSGDLRAENLSARYSQTGPTVLHNMSFHIKSGERVGVVGRTGSGKSSLTLALLQCIVTEGTIYYDGIPTNTLNLDALRSNITIIPQTPELISGTLRQNLDPFEQHDDVTLNDALRDAGLFALQEELDEARLTLDSSIVTGGGNLSVGQRQILALARAMVRGSKLLILDEATSAIDYKTDAIIQATLRHRLASDVTVITVAHRLQTIMDSDKIMVLDAGRIVEFDTPAVLLKKEDGVLKALVEGSGDKDTFYAMVEGNVMLF